MDKIKSPELERIMGVECYKSETPGIGGKLKQTPQDFVVEEITPEGIVLEVGKNNFPESNQTPKEYLHFTLEKTNWDTMRAIKVISRRLRVGHKRFGFAGTKDRRAVATQRVSVWSKTVDDLVKVRVKDVVLRDFVYSDERITLGGLWGNRFRVSLRDVSGDVGEVVESVERIAGELGGGFPNFFGVQRFGVVRPITHLVGKFILGGDFENAVLVYLAGVYEGESKESVEARKFLSDTRDFKEALKRFPKHLGYENAMLNHLAGYPTDYIGALRKLPKKLRWMFVHAYQSYVFNRALSRYIEVGEDVERLPLVGLESEVDEESRRVLEEEGVAQEKFEVKSMPELTSEGEHRECFIKAEDFRLNGVEDDELNAGRKKVSFEFKLPKGCYATVFLREFIKGEYW